ncbi:hypothetical protein TGPRC2_277020 [Toxoplasma gondii TgCatPRC2]|uniref:Uncharacterized protein n=3 Tax=Toxoplasma gondii TaxID=5811 RepID=A0A125YVK3_TOXGV|nr:hypothetical protein TGME49_277020 [Toxoplasma gondii ME49]EPT25415.1 hypothetical protein TGME49_277020 [Toxoplasma gondii ME49]ESS34682.1 hypothetical protein TGVEG_277020 [Toxoplasma gondii VEG]KYK65162.1 hypothetical protein TGPRC2_277020 [Toxoplasma gondii TgCatPRC2]|eukprot:XP_002370449.1 hypothetical protein TGME49_277020 [Toxoplasma gondii ME49]
MFSTSRCKCWSDAEMKQPRERQNWERRRSTRTFEETHRSSSFEKSREAKTQEETQACFGRWRELRRRLRVDAEQPASRGPRKFTLCCFKNMPVPPSEQQRRGEDVREEEQTEEDDDACRSGQEQGVSGHLRRDGESGEEQTGEDENEENGFADDAFTDKEDRRRQEQEEEEANDA